MVSDFEVTSPNIGRSIKDLEEIEIVEPAGDYGDIVTKEVVKSFLDDDGDIRKFTTYVFNVRLKSGAYSSDEWFDVYELDAEGNCIIGFNRSYHEIMALANIPNYCSSGGQLLKQYEYRYGAINRYGRLVVQPLYDRLCFNNEDSYTAYHNGNLGYVSNVDGHHITPIIFPHAQPFFEGKAAVEYKGEMGYVARDKVMTSPNNIFDYAIPPQFEVAGDFENGEAEVVIDGSHSTIDGSGNVTNSKSPKKLKQVN